jgi:hypothetical protein
MLSPPFCKVRIYRDYLYLYVSTPAHVFKDYLNVILSNRDRDMCCTLDGRIDEKVFPWNDTQLPLTRGRIRRGIRGIATYRISKEKFVFPV